MNSVVLIGRVVKDCELKVLNNSAQTNVIKFTLAVERDYKDRNGAKITDFLPVEYIGKNLTKLASFVTKGKQIGINGSINVDKVQESYFYKIKANKIELLGTYSSDIEQKDTFNNNNGTMNDNNGAGTFPKFTIVKDEFFDDDTPF